MPKPRTGRAAPMTPADMRQMLADGDPVSTIIQRAYTRNRMGREAVRAILFGGSINA